MQPVSRSAFLVKVILVFLTGFFGAMSADARTTAFLPQWASIAAHAAAIACFVTLMFVDPSAANIVSGAQGSGSILSRLAGVLNRLVVEKDKDSDNGKK